MSLSKPLPAFIPTANTVGNPIPIASSGSQTGFWEQWRPKWEWTTIGAIVVPVVFLGFGYYYWRRTSSLKKFDPPTKKGKQEKATAPGEGEAKKSPAKLSLKEIGNNYFKAHNYKLALDNYNLAVEQHPPPEELATIFQNRAAVFEKLQDYVQVINECTAAIKLNPVYVKALQRRARAYVATGFLEEGLEDITAVCILESFQNPSSIKLADSLLSEIGEKEAGKVMQEKKPMEPSPHTVASFMRSFHNCPMSLIWNGRRAEHMNGHSTEEVGPDLKGYRVAEAKLALHQIDKIIEHCTEEINSGSSKHLPEAHLLRGILRFLWGDGLVALADYDAVISDQSASVELKASAWIKKGVYYAYLPEDKNKDAEGKDLFEACFVHAEQLTPDNVDVFHQRGQVYLMKGKVDEASVQIHRGSQLAPEFPLAPTAKLYLQFRLACMTQDQSGLDESLREFNKCLRKFPNFPDIFGLYGQMLLEIDRTQEAQQQFDRVIELEPNNITVVVHKAMLQYRLTNDVEGALKMLHEACKIDNNSEFIHETIGTLSLQRGDLEQSAKSFAKALELSKTHQEILMLCSMKKAAEVQAKVRAKLGSFAS